MIYKKYENSGTDDQTAPEFPYRKETHEKTKPTALYFYHSTEFLKMQAKKLVENCLECRKTTSKIVQNTQ